MKITKGDAKAALGFRTNSELAVFFKTSKQAVGQWGSDSDPLPDGRQWELRARRPDLFSPPSPEGQVIDRAA